MRVTAFIAELGHFVAKIGHFLGITVRNLSKISIRVSRDLNASRIENSFNFVISVGFDYYFFFFCELFYENL